MSRTLFYIGFALFFIGVGVRLYYGLKTKRIRQENSEWIDTPEGNRFRKINYFWWAVSWVGITVAIFSI